MNRYNETDKDNVINKTKEFCEGYKNFINSCKTEKECINEIECILISKGYKKYSKNNAYAKNDKIYMNIKDKMIIASKIGDIKSGNIRINISHVDSPRLDLKPTPIYEDKDIVYFKTHYYGNIKKYQWTAIPLALHCATDFKNDTIGFHKYFSIGEKYDEPVFYISDLPPHLSYEQNKRNLFDGIGGEELNVIVSTFPYAPNPNYCGEYFSAKNKKTTKDAFFKYLKNKYNITEENIFYLDIEFVPAMPVRDIGLDGLLIGGYGQDDRACVYAALMAEIENVSEKNTSITIFADKEEVGSNGMAGAKSSIIKAYIDMIMSILNLDTLDLVYSAKAISADTVTAYDSTFTNAFDSNNAFYLHKGCYISKHSGNSGKFGICDCSIEYLANMILMLENNGIKWQKGEMGKIDFGCAGTMSKFISNLGIDTIEMGIPVMSMHSPYEIASKIDIYNMYLAFKYFLK